MGSEGASARGMSKYTRTVPVLTIDVYRVLAAFGVADPAIQHAVKKLLCAGSRGHKDFDADINEAIEALHRCLEMRAEDATECAPLCDDQG